jgi:hypothetical protein
MTEAAIRALVISSIVDAKVVEEVCVGRGRQLCRVDIASFSNVELHGFEIKSDQDTLKRLGRQLEVFSKVFGTLTVVAGHKHFAKVSEAAPWWVGIMLAADDELTCLRVPGQNPGRCLRSTVALLWRTEILQVLRQHGAPVVGTKATMITRLIRTLAPEEVVAAVATGLKERPAWLRLSDDDKAIRKARNARRKRNQGEWLAVRRAINAGNPPRKKKGPY